MDYRRSNEQELINESIAGDADAFGEIVTRYLDHAFNFARSYVRENEAAEDIAQESFLKAWKSIKRFKAGYSFKSWLFTIIRNTALDYIKKKRPRAFSDMEQDGEDESGLDSFASTVTDEEPLPDRIFEMAELAEHVDRALSSLPRDHQAVIIMRYRQDMTFEEIAQTMGKPMNTVKSWHRRSLWKIRDKLMHLR